MVLGKASGGVPAGGGVGCDEFASALRAPGWGPWLSVNCHC